MRSLFYYSNSHWTGCARAFAIAARGLSARGHPVTIVCCADTSAELGFAREGVDVVAIPQGGTVAGDAWRLRAVLKEKFTEAVFLHTEREQVVASTAMRMAERGAVIRRIAAGGSVTRGRGVVAARMTAPRLLFTTEADRARAGIGDKGFVAPLGIDVARVENERAASRALLGFDDETQLIICAVDRHARSRVSTAMRTIALLGERHPDLRLALVGSLGDDDDAHMHAAALGVRPLVHFLGERDDQSSLLAAADVGWVAAEGDDGAFACLDFMAARVPIIAERSSLISHFVPDGIAGVLLPPAEPSDTAAAVASFLANESQRTAMGRAGHTRARRDFTEDAMIEGFAAAAGAAGDRTLWTTR